MVKLDILPMAILALGGLASTLPVVEPRSHGCGKYTVTNHATSALVI